MTSSSARNSPVAFLWMENNDFHILQHGFAQKYSNTIQRSKTHFPSFSHVFQSEWVCVYNSRAKKIILHQLHQPEITTCWAHPQKMARLWRSKTIHRWILHLLFNPMLSPFPFYPNLSWMSYSIPLYSHDIYIYISLFTKSKNTWKDQVSRSNRCFFS